MYHTPSTKILTSNGWVSFRDLEECTMVHTEHGWQEVNIYKKYTQGDCYIYSQSDSTDSEYEFPDKDVLLSYGNNKESLCEIPLINCYKNYQLNGSAVYLGRHNGKADLRERLENREWCSGYLFYYAFVRGTISSGSRSIIFSSSISDDRIARYEAIMENSKYSCRFNRFNRKNPPAGKRDYYYRFYIPIDELSHCLHVGPLSKEGVLKVPLDYFSSDFLEGMCYALLDSTGLRRADKSTINVQTLYKASIIDFLLTVHMPWSIRTIERDGFATIIVKKNLVTQRIVLSEMIPFEYRGYIYWLDTSSTYLVRPELDIFPYSSRGKKDE